jgi:hypothetical protein
LVLHWFNGHTTQVMTSKLAAPMCQFSFQAVYFSRWYVGAGTKIILHNFNDSLLLILTVRRTVLKLLSPMSSVISICIRNTTIQAVIY